MADNAAISRAEAALSPDPARIITTPSERRKGPPGGRLMATHPAGRAPPQVAAAASPSEGGFYDTVTVTSWVTPFTVTARVAVPGRRPVSSPVAGSKTATGPATAAERGPTTRPGPPLQAYETG